MLELTAMIIKNISSSLATTGRTQAAMVALLTAALCLAPMALSAVQSGFTTLILSSGAQIETYLHVSENRSAPWRVLLAFPPGSQDQSMVRAGLQNWLSQLKSSGWTVISPAAKDRQLFVGDRLQIVPELLNTVRERHGLNFDKVFLFGVSNGGISALESAAQYPDLFHSVTVAPGLLRSSGLIGRLSNLPVNVIVGEHDGRWTEGGTELVRQLNAQGGNADLMVVPGAGHGAFHEIDYRQFVGRLTRATGMR